MNDIEKLLQRLWDEVAFNPNSSSKSCTDEIMSNDDVWGYFGHSTVWLFALCIVVFGVLYLYEKTSNGKKNRFWNFITNNLLWFIIVSWSLGFITYCIGTWVPDDASFFSVVPMAILHATGMFLLESDISAIHSPQHNSALFMFFFNISHFSAMFCSMVFILHHFGFLLMKLCKINILSHLPLYKQKDIYIFWGINKNSLLLAKDINDNHSNDTTIIFVRTHEDDEAQSQKMGFQRIFDIVKMKDKELKQLRDLDCHIISSFQRLSTVVVENRKAQLPILRKDLKLKPLVRIINRASGRINFLLLGEDSESNIRATVNLLLDEDLATKNTHIYCHARKSLKNNFVEYYPLYHPTLGMKTKVHLVDSAYLSVMELKSNLYCHPVNMVEYSDKATVDEDFNAIIIGFGETGEESLKYLCEFSSFVKNNGKRTGFHCSVIDKNIDSLKGNFLEQVPAIGEIADIDWIKAEAGTTEFWDAVKEKIDVCHCIVLALHDDELQTNMAVQLFRKLCTERTNEELKKIKILVRVYDDSSTSRLIDLSNLIRKENQEDGVSEDLFIGPEIIPFGQPSKIYSFESILNDRILHEAQTFNYNYQTVLGEIPNIESMTAQEVWINCFEDMKHIMSSLKERNAKKIAKGKSAESTNHLWVIQDVIRQIEENISNSMHQRTKTTLAKGLSKNISLKRVSTTTKYVDVSERDRAILINLARCEHERWIASHILKGYQKGMSKDHRLKTHPDITPWDDLDEYTQSYDCSVIDTTLLTL